MTALRTTSLMCLLAAAVATATPARSDEGPIVLGRPQRPPILTLDPLTGSIGVLALLEHDSSKTNGASTTSESAVVQEYLTLTSGGGIVSKNFFAWHGSVTLGIDEEWSHSPSQDNTGYAFAPAYDLTGDLLPNSIIPIDMYARRTESYIESTFQPLIKDISSEYGANINYLSPTIPTSLNVSHTEDQQDSTAGSTNYTLSENHLGFQTAYDPAEQHHLNLNYQFTQVDQNNPGLINEQNTRGFFGTSYDAQSATLGHLWQIDKDARYTLSESLTYSSEDGTFPFTNLGLSEYLRMQHTDNFETALQYNYTDQEYFTTSTKTQQIIGSFTHRLFESLTTNGQAGATFNNSSYTSTDNSPSSSSDSKSWFTNMSTTYTKKMPLGVFGANLGLGFNQTINDAIGSTQQVTNDIQTFNDPQPIVLTQPNVNPNSIAVFNAAGTRQYILNKDYTVQQIGNTTQIFRTFTSDINPGQTVRLNYDLSPLPGYTADTTTFAGGVRYDFNEGPLNGLGVYVQYTGQNQTTNSTAVLADDINDLTVGGDYHIWKLTFRADYDDHQSTLAAFKASRFSALYNSQISQRSSLALGASQAFVDYPQTDSNTYLTTVDGHFNYQITRDLKTIISAQWRNEQDSRFGNTMGIEEQAELRWTIRQTQFFFMVRHTNLEATTNSTETVSAQFGLTRSF
ncbi:MAG TPA: hypothetical protein VM008_14295 [Phycisphaerae bacterium]|nr:hypothetical protein [Phycisphaerae bacterium]